MTRKQEKFVAEYLIDLNATQAAIRAGYKRAAAGDIGRQLLRKTPIAERIRAATEQNLAQTGVTAERVIEEVARIAFVNLKDFYDGDNFKPVSQWSAEMGAAVAATETILKNVAAGDGIVDRLYKFKLWDKLKALELLAKRFGLLVDRVEVTGELTLIPGRLEAARKRLAAHRGQA